MALTLPAELVREKNKVSSTVPWLLFLETSLSDEGNTPINLVRNIDDIVYNGTTYQAFPFEIDSNKQVSKGEIPTTSLKVCNINQVVQTYIENYDGLVGQSLTLGVIAKPEGEEDYLLAASWTYNITACIADQDWVTWTLGGPNPLMRRFPLNRYLANHCNWASRFNKPTNIECGIYVAGSTITCSGSFQRCEELNNTHRFGGYPGLGKGNVKLV